MISSVEAREAVSVAWKPCRMARMLCSLPFACKTGSSAFVLILFQFVCVSRALQSEAMLARHESTEHGIFTLRTNIGRQASIIPELLYGETPFTQRARLFFPKITIKISAQTHSPSSRKESSETGLPSSEKVVRQDRNAVPEEYRREYHRVLVKLFPSANKTLSIESGRTDSFTNFLLADSVREHAHYIIATLFLLSEGVPVPIQCTADEIFLPKKSSSGEFFRVCTRTWVYSERKKRLIKVQQKEAAEIIQFFQTYGCEEELPKTKESFETGSFMDSPQFLVQSYMFELWKAPEDLIKSNTCVYNILMDLSQAEKRQRTFDEPTLLDRVFKKCFITVSEKKKQQPSSEDAASSSRNQSLGEQAPAEDESDHFIDYLIEHRNSLQEPTPEETLDAPMIRQKVSKAVRDMLTNDPKNINSFLMIKDIHSDFNYKKMLVAYLAIHAYEKNMQLHPAHPTVLFISSMLDSVSLDVPKTRNQIMHALIIMHDVEVLYSGIHIGSYARAEMLNDRAARMQTYYYMLDSGCPAAFVKYMHEYCALCLSEGKDVFLDSAPQFSERTLPMVFQLLFQSRSVEHAKALAKVLQKGGEGGRRLEKSLGLAWFAFACSDSSVPAQLLVDIYRSVVFSGQEKCTLCCSLCAPYASAALERMEEQKASLCPGRAENAQGLQGEKYARIKAFFSAVLPEPAQ
ncbi:uncharacterized protein NEMAJ01_1956 [Nematocida major]|uniref:uncharacterized protein n=1 Tax=Nematocida major TaxID=1912982 RepID=UPI0020088D92|nr:uncharacterized protein NEMAJ01_1956 [Nematocida major]KAH9387060.1 hypothetical protein NEMAJ01_1956 [Nematocida major]